MKETRNRPTADYQTKDLYKRYTKRISNHVDEKTYNKFWDIIGDKIFEKVIYEAEKHSLPAEFTVVVREVNVKRIKNDGTLSKANKIDWKATHEYHKLNPEKRHIVVYHKNKHSRGRVFKYKLERSNFVKGHHVYRLQLVRNHIRALPKAIKNNNVDFYKEY